MATQIESTKLVLEGDKEYKEKLESIGLQYSKLYSELEKLETETKNAANAKDILKKKVDLLKEAQGNRKKFKKIIRIR